MTNAFRSAESDRPGAAFVSLPMDIMVAPAKCDILTPPAYSGAGPADSAAIKEAARLIYNPVFARL
jgi:acetolactate synthase I/II/III large subunit